MSSICSGTRANGRDETHRFLFGKNTERIETECLHLICCKSCQLVNLFTAWFFIKIGNREKKIRKKIEAADWVKTTVAAMKTSHSNRTLSLVKCLNSDYAMMIKLYKIAKLNFCVLSTNSFHVKAKAEKFTAASSRCRQNVKHENFTSSKHYTKSLLLVQQDCFSS